jgi:MFS family permease
MRDRIPRGAQSANRLQRILPASVSTSYRNVFLLACCQALLLTNASGLIAMNGVVGYALVDNKTLATLGATTYVLGSALSTMPMSLWMARVGRRVGFMAGAGINILGCGLAALALYWHSFALFCVATAVIGIYNAVGLQYRFAATEVAAPADKARAISLVLAGGIVGGFLGPALSRWGKDWFATPFLGSFVLLAGVALVALAVQSLVTVPKPSAAERSGGGRPLREIVRQPVFIVAALSAGLGYGLMNLLMTATPLAMDFCALPYAMAATVISWHVVGMYGPGFVTGSLIGRFGVLRVIVAGVVVMAVGAVVALQGVTLPHFVAALVLVGIGWNFMYTGGTTLLTEAYSPSEKARTQGANDFIVFAIMGISSFSSGALVSAAGWSTMNIGALPVLLAIGLAVLWYARRRVAGSARAS